MSEPQSNNVPLGITLMLASTIVFALQGRYLAPPGGHLQHLDGGDDPLLVFFPPS